MKLVRFGHSGQEHPGVLDGQGRLRDLSGALPDINPTTVTPAGLGAIARLPIDRLPIVSGNPRIGVPLGGIGKLVAVGLNYRDHAAEAGMAVPSDPILFLKATTCISGPDDPVMLPRGSVKSDWEVELGIIIGSTARYVSVESALDHVAGYCVINDVSERAYQIERGSQWDKGKGCDTFGPIGPWLVTRDEVPDPQNLEMWLELNGERMQSGNTRTMIFGCAQLVSAISAYMTLLPGDVIATGTPPGVGMGKKPPRFLRAGDVMRLSIAGLGVQRQQVVAYAG